MLPLDLSEHTEVVLVNFFDLNLLVILVGLLQILELHMRHVMFLKVYSYNVLRQRRIYGMNAVVAACEQEHY